MLSEKCGVLFRNLIGLSSDSDRYYTEMRIAKEKCNKDNLHFCTVAEKLEMEHDAIQTKVDVTLESFFGKCVSHKDITKYGD